MIDINISKRIAFDSEVGSDIYNSITRLKLGLVPVRPYI